MGVNSFFTHGDPNDDLPRGSGQNSGVAVDADNNINALETYGGDFRIGPIITDVHRFSGCVANFSSDLEFVWATQFSIEDGSIAESSPADIMNHPTSDDAHIAGFTGHVCVRGLRWGAPNASSDAIAVSLSH